MKTKFILCLALVLSGCATESDYWQAKAAQVTIGMIRGQVEEILPQWSGSNTNEQIKSAEFTSNGIETYWVSENWRVSVKYDQTGGAGSVSNRVIGPVKLEKHEYDLKPIDGVKFNFQPSIPNS